MNDFYSLPPQSIFVPDEYGCLFSVPLITADTVRQVLRCHIRGDAFRLRLETALLTKYFPLSLVKVDPALSPSFFPRGTTVSGLSYVAANPNMVHQGPPVVLPEKKTVMPVIATDIPPTVTVPKIIEILDDPVVIKQEIVDNDTESDEDTTVVSVKRRLSSPILDASTEVDDYSAISENADDTEIFEDPAQDNTDFRVFRSAPQRMEHSVIERTVRFTKALMTFDIPIIIGQLKGLKCHHITSFRLELSGPFDSGQCNIMTRKDNAYSPWLVYDTIAVTGDLSNSKVVSRTGVPIPFKVDVNGPLIRQISLSCVLQGRLNSVVRVRIKMTTHLLCLAYKGNFMNNLANPKVRNKKLKK